MSTVQEAFEAANSFDVHGTLLETNVVAYYQSKLFGDYLNVLYSIEAGQNVTFVYVKRRAESAIGAKEFIECMERQLYPFAEKKRLAIQASNYTKIYVALNLVKCRAFDIQRLSIQGLRVSLTMQM